MAGNHSVRWYNFVRPHWKPMYVERAAAVPQRTLSEHFSVWWQEQQQVHVRNYLYWQVHPVICLLITQLVEGTEQQIIHHRMEQMLTRKLVHI